MAYTSGERTRQRGSGTLRARLAEAEAMIDAIRTGQVDALVVSGPRGLRTRTIDGATHPYVVLLNAMSDGGALLDGGGTILFANRGLGRITHSTPRALRGSSFLRLIVPAERPFFETLMEASARRKVSREFRLSTDRGSHTPVGIALSPLSVEGASRASRERVVRMAIVTDLSSRERAEATRLGLIERVISAEDDERRRVSRELHDETGQSLTAILVGLRSITDARLPPSVKPTALRLRRLAARTVDEVGRIARGLHPVVLDDTGLATAARRYVRDYTQAFGIAVQLSARGLDSPRLPSLVASTTYRILQEALTNVARHARAQHVNVELKRHPSWLAIRVQDDGVGFDASPGAGGPRLGLHGMRERATLLGGEITIETRRGHGTTIRARIPVKTRSRR